MTQKNTARETREAIQKWKRRAGNCQGPFAEAQSFSARPFPSTLVTVQALPCSCTLKGPARSTHNLSSQIRQKMPPNQGPTPFSDPLLPQLGLSHNPYYTQLHHDLRAYCRNYISSELLPYAQEWETAGQVPEEVRIRHCQ